VSRRVSPRCLIRLIDKDAGNLARGAEGNVERDGQAGRGGGEKVGGEEAQERRDAGEGAGGGDDEAAVARVVGVRWEKG